MSKLILVTSTQYPGYGGAATNAYALIKFLKIKEYDVIGIFFEDKNVNVDPDNIGNVYRFEWTIFDKYLLDRSHSNKIESYRNMLNVLLKREPDIMVCKNYRAPVFCRVLYPSVKNIYL